MSTLAAGPVGARWLGAPPDPADDGRRGLLAIQIDGLSYGRLVRAMRRGHMSHLRRALASRRLHLDPYLSEIPTSTPAFQAGMFYGTNDNIPGFQFYDRAERRVFRMGLTECANDVECGLPGSGLLAGGSVYSCVYTGGAASSNFVFSTMLAPRRWRWALRAWDAVFLILLNAIAYARIFTLMGIEIVAGLYDFIRRTILGKARGRLWKEFETVGIRAGLTVGVREAITLGASIDLARGVPVIYLNFLGYDEHAHLRGPDSRFARWSLRGIDRCIRRLHRAAASSPRPYDLLVLSDHGQCVAKPFAMADPDARTVTAWLREETGLNDAVGHETQTRPSQAARGVTERLVNGAPPLFPSATENLPPPSEPRPPSSAGGAGLPDPPPLTVVSSGPLGYVYFSFHDTPRDAGWIETNHPGLLHRLAAHPGMGFVTVRADVPPADDPGPTRRGDVLVIARGGARMTLRDGAPVERDGEFPFDEAMDPAHVHRGLWRVTLFPRAGDICLWGGGAPAGDITFSEDRGAHSGWTDGEVEAFVMTSPGLELDPRNLTRHADFHRALAARFGTAGPPAADAPKQPEPEEWAL